MRNVAARPTSYFVYKLIPPRPTFPVDITDAEAAIMQQHFAYWNRFEQKRDRRRAGAGARAVRHVGARSRCRR